MIQRRIHIFLFCVTPIFLVGCGLFLSSHHNTQEYTAVVAATDACDLAKVRQATKQDQHLLMVTEWDKATLLHDAVGHNCTDLAVFLIEKGANVNARKTDGVTPLHLAAQRGNIPIAEMLIRHGANINAIDDQGWTPFDRAKKWNHEDAAAFLRKQGGHGGAAGE